MRDCPPGEEHRGRGDDRSKRPEVGMGLACGGGQQARVCRAERVEAWDGRPQRPGQIRSAKSLLVSARKGSC